MPFPDWKICREESKTENRKGPNQEKAAAKGIQRLRYGLLLRNQRSLAITNACQDSVLAKGTLALSKQLLELRFVSFESGKDMYRLEQRPIRSNETHTLQWILMLHRMSAQIQHLFQLLKKRNVISRSESNGFWTLLNFLNEPLLPPFHIGVHADRP